MKENSFPLFPHAVLQPGLLMLRMLLEREKKEKSPSQPTAEKNLPFSVSRERKGKKKGEKKGGKRPSSFVP